MLLLPRVVVLCTFFIMANAAALAKLTKTRSGYKSWITKDIAALDVLIGQVPIPRQQLKQQLAGLEIRINKVRDVQVEMFSLIDEDDLENAVELADKFDRECSISIAKYTPFLEVSTSASSTSGQSSSSSSQPNNLYKLPKVELSNFSGNLIEWLPFYQPFLNSVDKLAIAKHLKLQILRNHVKEEPLRLIEWYPLTDESYDPALKTLVDKYDNKDRLREAYVEELIALRDTASSMTLRRIYDKLYSNVNILESLEVNRDRFAIILVPMIRSIFSKEIKLQWAKYERAHKQQSTTAPVQTPQSTTLPAQTQQSTAPVQTPTNRLTLFLEFLQEEVEIREAAEASPSIKISDTKRQVAESDKIKEKIKKKSENDSSSSATAAFLTDTSSGSKNRESNQPNQSKSGNSSYASSSRNFRFNQQNFNNQNQSQIPSFGQSGGQRYNNNLPPCPFCNSPTHHPERCQRATEYSPVQAAALIQRAQRCDQCLAYHPNQNCKSTKKCMICANSHHHLLCPKRLSTTASSAVHVVPVGNMMMMQQNQNLNPFTPDLAPTLPP